MTVITISTVGFKEVETLNDNTRIFTIVLIVLSVVSAAVIVAMLTEIIISNFSIKQFKNRKMKRKIQELNNHIIVLGFGLTGKKVVQRLQSENKDFVIIEQDKERIHYLQNKTEFLWIKGDATQDQNLMNAGIQKATSLISTLPSDQANLFAVLSARQLNNKVLIVSRLVDTTAQKKLKIAGANQVVMLEKLGGDHLASLIVTPDLLDFFDKISISDGDNRNIKELKFECLCPDQQEKKISELTKLQNTGCKIIGYKDENNQFQINPDDDFVLKKNSSVIVIGNSEQIKKLNSEFDSLN